MPLLERLISLIAPAQCLACGQEGSLLCALCGRANFQMSPEHCFMCKKPSKASAVCPNCRSQSHITYVWSRTIYQGLAKQLIHDYKFARAQFAAPIIAAFMAEALPLLPRNTCLVPVPTATSRYRIRGFDHAHLLAKELAKQTGLQFCPILTRLGQTRQVGASRSERQTQLKHAFRLTSLLPNNPPTHLTSSVPDDRRMPPPTTIPPILLVDDVTTTGATLEAAATILQAAGFKTINALTFALKIS